MTKTTYYNDAYLTELDTVALSCAPAKGGFEVVFERTCFFPGGGGHPCDVGTAGGARVRETFERGGEIIHLCDSEIPLGQTVRLCADRERRLCAMRVHTAEHIVSGLIWRDRGIRNVGFHMTLRGAILDLDAELSPEALRETERLANRAVRDSLAVISGFPGEITDTRKMPETDEPLRLVSIEGIDSCCCCGLHISRTGEIGLIKIIGAQRHRGGMRVEILAGEAAFEDYRKKHDIVCALGARFSCRAQDVPAAAERQAEQLSELKRQLAAANSSIIETLAQKLLKKTEEELEYWTVAVFDGDIVALCNRLAEKNPAAVFARRGDCVNYCMISPMVDIRPLCKKLNEALGGRGGGKPNFCQGSLPGADAESAAELFRALCFETVRCF